MEIGVMLPGVDPSIGEMLVAAVQERPTTPLGEIVLALIAAAPASEIALELMNAAIVLVSARQLAWIDTPAMQILLGIQHVIPKKQIVVGGAKWPISALTSGPPKLITVTTARGRVPIWTASDGLEGAVVRASEVVALARTLVQECGGKVIEDRFGDEEARASLVERAAEDQVKHRAQARSEVERLTVVGRMGGSPRAGVALAEALPGSLQKGMEIRHQDEGSPLFEVVRRINESFVLIAAIDDATVTAPAGSWVYADGREVEGMGKVVGFTEEPATR